MIRARRSPVPVAARLLAVSMALLLPLCLTLVAPAPAAAQDARTQARQAYQRGKQLFDAGNFTGAITEFERANDLAPSPVLDFNIGLAHDRLGNAAEAVDSYRAYLQAVPDATNRATVEARIAALEPKIPRPMQPMDPVEGPAEQAPPPAPGVPPRTAEAPGTSPPAGVAPPAAPPAEAVGPDAAPGPAAPPAPPTGPVDQRSAGPVAPRIPARTGDPELDRVLEIDLDAVRARFRGPAVGPPQR